jgi:hypothetical protein
MDLVFEKVPERKSLQINKVVSPVLPSNLIACIIGSSHHNLWFYTGNNEANKQGTNLLTPMP